MGRNNHCTVEERKVITKLRESGKTYRTIAELLGRSPNMIVNALKPVKSCENRGRPRKTSSCTDRRIAKLSKRDPFLSSKDILKELEENVSSRTIRRRLADFNLHGRSARKVPFLSSRNTKQRQRFAKEHISWRGEEMEKKWRNILWSDESKFNLQGSDGRTFVRRPPNQEFSSAYTRKTIKHGAGI